MLLALSVWGSRGGQRAGSKRRWRGRAACMQRMQQRWRAARRQRAQAASGGAQPAEECGGGQRAAVVGAGEGGNVEEREKVRVWVDLTAVIVCTNLKEWKIRKKTYERYIGSADWSRPWPGWLMGTSRWCVWLGVVKDHRFWPRKSKCWALKGLLKSYTILS